MTKFRLSSSFARSITFTLCLTLSLSGLPFRASTQSQTPDLGVRTQGAPSPNLPNIDDVRNTQPKEIKQPPPTPAKRCRHWDKKCKDLKEKKTSFLFSPEQDEQRAMVAAAKPESFDWQSPLLSFKSPLNLFNTLGSSTVDLPIGQRINTARGGKQAKSDATPPAGRGADSKPMPHAFASSLTPATAAQFINFETKRMDPNNRTGSPGEDLFSGNYNWSLPLLGLQGRSGLDLNLTLSYNSLVWLKSGNLMRFDPDLGWPGPGFRLGFPTFFGPYTNMLTNRISYQVITPSGGVVELRQVNGTTWDAEDSSYTRLTLSANGDYVLTTADGTQYIYGQTLQIKDRNGNLMTVTYSESGQIGTITDTLGRVITFNYGEFYDLQTITQNWNGAPKTLVTFHYADEFLYTNFQGMYLDNVTYGQQIPVLSQIDLVDGSRYKFQYNTYLQVSKIERYGGGTFLRAWQSYNLPASQLSGAQTDCPRFTQRTDMAYDWSNGVATNFCFSNPADPMKPCIWIPDHPWGQVTTPDGTIQKQIFATTGWQRGLPTQSESWEGSVKRKWTTLQWEQSCTGTIYPCNPRVSETNIYDDTDGDGVANNRRRVATTFTTYNLPLDVTEYDSNATTALRRTHTDYNLTTTYTNRRIIGLPSASLLYDGSNALYSKVEYLYDENGYLQATPTTPTQHDSTNYGIGFLAGRGNQTTVRRYNVADQTYVEWKTGYNVTGSPTFSRDPRYGVTNAQTTISYTDAWISPTGVPLSGLYTFAYPTTVTDQDGYQSTVKYDFDLGAVRRTKNPKGVGVQNKYDGNARLWRIEQEINEATTGVYTYYNFDSSQKWITSNSTIEAGQGEFLTVTTFDGHDRVRGILRDHPGSAGGYSAQYNFYDTMGRPWQQSNPTETNANWIPTGDDVAGWAWSKQEYDWKGRPTFSYNQDHTAQNESKREISYVGCGCAGSDVTTIKGEIVSGTDKRTQKVWRDVLGRTVKSQILNYNGTAYSTTLTEYNVRDQATAIKVFKGDAAIGASCPLGTCEQTDLVYDGHGRLQKKYAPVYQDNNVAPPYNGNPSARSSNVQYYSDDTVNIETDPRGATTTFTYNNRRLVSGISYFAPGGVAAKPSVSFNYDQLGIRSFMADGAGTVSYNINTLGQIQSETRQFTMSGAPTGYFTTNYNYGLAGQLKSVTDPFGDQINYSYDKSGRVTAATGTTPFAGVTNYLSGVQYRAWGAVKNNRTFDIRMRLTSTYQSGTVNYQYNKANDLTYAEMPASMPYHQTYGYDHVGRLTSVSTPEINVPSQYVQTQSSPPNGLPSTYKARPFTTNVTYDEFDNAVNTSSNYWHDIKSNLTADPQSFNTTYVNGRAKKDGVAGKVYNNKDEVWTYNAMGQVTYDTRTGETYDAAGQKTRTDNGPNIYVNYAYDGDGRQVKFDQKRDDGTTELRYRIHSTVLGGILTDVKPTGQKIETRVYTFVYPESTIRQVKAYSVPNYGSYPDTVVFEGSDPHGTRATVWNRDSNNYKTLSLASPGAYVEDMNWQWIKDRYVSNIANQISYGQYAASHALDNYHMSIDPKNPGTGCSLDGVKERCDKVLREANRGNLKSIVFSTTGGMGGVGGDTGALAAAFGLAAGQAASTTRYVGRRQIAGKNDQLTFTFDGYEGADVVVFKDAPRFEDVYANNVTAFGLLGVGFGLDGGQQQKQLMQDQQGGKLLPKQCDVLKELLKRENEHGTVKAARMSSVNVMPVKLGNITVSNVKSDLLLQEYFDTTYRPNIRLADGGEFDLDWFTTLLQNSVIDPTGWLGWSTLGLAQNHILYSSGKHLWNFQRRQEGKPTGNFFPYADPGERRAVLELYKRSKYKDIFTTEFFTKYCPN